MPRARAPATSRGGRGRGGRPGVAHVSHEASERIFPTAESSSSARWEAERTLTAGASIANADDAFVLPRYRTAVGSFSSPLHGGASRTDLTVRSGSEAGKDAAQPSPPLWLVSSSQHAASGGNGFAGSLLTGPPALSPLWGPPTVSVLVNSSGAPALTAPSNHASWSYPPSASPAPPQQQQQTPWPSTQPALPSGPPLGPPSVVVRPPAAQVAPLDGNMLDLPPDLLNALPYGARPLYDGMAVAYAFLRNINTGVNQTSNAKTADGLGLSDLREENVPETTFRLLQYEILALALANDQKAGKGPRWAMAQWAASGANVASMLVPELKQYILGGDEAGSASIALRREPFWGFMSSTGSLAQPGTRPSADEQKYRAAYYSFLQELLLRLAVARVDADLRRDGVEGPHLTKEGKDLIERQIFNVRPPFRILEAMIMRDWVGLRVRRGIAFNTIDFVQLPAASLGVVSAAAATPATSNGAPTPPLPTSYLDMYKELMLPDLRVLLERHATR